MTDIQQFSIKETGIEGVKLISPFFVKDSRGYFIKSFENDIYKSYGLDLRFSETFETRSCKNVIRGLHFQTVDPQDKLVSVSIGKIYDVVVDLRKDSPTYGKWEGFELSEEKMMALYIPAGFAHGFLSQSDISIINYKCCGKYLKEYDTGIIWNDKLLGIDWPIDDYKSVIISSRDSSLMTFEDFNKKYSGLCSK